MWTRQELKNKAKPAFKANYWKAVLAALVLAIALGGFSLAFTTKGLPTLPTSTNSSQVTTVLSDDGKTVTITTDNGGTFSFTADGKDVASYMDGDIDWEQLEALGINGEVISPNQNTDEGPLPSSKFDIAAAAVTAFTLLLAVLVALALSVAIYIFLVSPLEVGASRFFLRNLNQRAEAKDLAFAYDTNYKETVKTLFLRNLFIFLWSLLLIIPGIYKAYQYRMIPYLLAEDPTMTKNRAFAESKRLMDGNKWNAFVLDLSFIGWHILSGLTLGILGVFYVAPYQAQTNAALYEKLRYGTPTPEAPMSDYAYTAPAAANPAVNAQPDFANPAAASPIPAATAPAENDTPTGSPLA